MKYKGGPMEGIDREYTARQIYGRLGRAVWRYKKMLFVGVACGMLVGGSLWPLFEMVQPTLTWLQTPTVEKSEEGGAGIPTHDEHVVEKKEKETDKWVSYAERVAGFVGVRVVDDRGVPTWEFLLLAMMAFPIFAGLMSAAGFCNHYALRWIGVHVVKDLRNALFTHLQNQSLAFFGRVDVGKLMSRCTHDTGAVDHVISVNIADLSRIPFLVATALVFVVRFAIKNDMLGLLLLVVVGFPLVIAPLVWLGRMVRRWTQAAMQRISGVSSRMHENFTGIRVVKAYHTEAKEVAGFREHNHKFVKASMRTVRFALVMDPVVQFASCLLVCAFVALCYAQGRTLAAIIPLLVPFFVLYKPVKQLGKIQASLAQGRAALTRIYSLLDLDTSLPESPNPVAKATFDASVVFDSVDFAYAPGAEKAVSGASFEIPKGRMVAVVGATGSGKTTLANLLARFYDPVAGRVLMDGVDLRDIATPDLRNLVGVVTQETILFNTTVRDNIAYGTPKATQEQIEDAARMANAHDFITAHREGYDRVCGEKGFVLSGGERQRVAIARAILKNPPILILDEATSALDTVTERQVQEAITRLMEHRTVFAIAHRLSTIRAADLILVVEKGVIIERGTHDELFAQSDGRYRRLCEMQQGENV
ncbi:MAG: ABC transporter ATP-binding protein/permease [Kiritimatiellaeota bacterium]|nr:ABC transporter ATP-binding protein/permease [Kiritimatiellota bacterium]